MGQPELALPALLVCVAWSAVGPLLAQDDDTIYWSPNYQQAVQEARRTQKPILLEFRCEA